MSILIPLPWDKPPLTGNRTRGNPYARANEVKAAKFEASIAVGKRLLDPIVGAEVTLHFRPKDKRRRDADGLAPTLKVCLDALVAMGVLPDDSWVHVPAATCRIHPPTDEPAAMWLELDVLTEYEALPARQRQSQPRLRQRHARRGTPAEPAEKESPPMSKPAQHGTETGYRRHLKAGEKACWRCRSAANKATREREARALAAEIELTGGTWVPRGGIQRFERTAS